MQLFIVADHFSRMTRDYSVKNNVLLTKMCNIKNIIIDANHKHHRVSVYAV